MPKQNIEINVKKDATFDQLYPKTSADIVDYNNTTSGIVATNVQGAIDLKVNKGEYTNFTFNASGWIGSAPPYAYDLSATYPSNKYDLEFNLPKGTSADMEQIIALARISGNATDNIAYAYGVKPTTNITIAIKGVLK